jgi:hypothetical protein
MATLCLRVLERLSLKVGGPCGWTLAATCVPFAELLAIDPFEQATAVAGVLSFSLALVGLSGENWIKGTFCEKDPVAGEICVERNNGLFSGSMTTSIDGKVSTNPQFTKTFACSDPGLKPDTLECENGGAPTLMIIATILFVVGCGVTVLLALDKPVPVLPKPVKSTGVIFVACAGTAHVTPTLLQLELRTT